MKTGKRIAIVGAGVAGLALAILATRRGFQVSVYERGSQIASMGAGVTLWPNAMYVLHQMGVGEAIERVGGAPRFMRQFDRHGVRQGEFDIGAVNALSGFSSVTILRRDLMTILADTLEALGGKVYFGCPITREKVDLLQQGFDLVVGADGRMNSVVRQALYPAQARPRYQGFINIIGISRLGEGVLDNVIHDVRGPGERFGIVPVKSGICYWAAAWSAGMDRDRPVSDWFGEMHRRFSGWFEPVKTVLESCEAASLKRIFVHDLDPLPYWHQGKVVILGDAAHAPLPTSGQGACQALEDAWHLARLLEEQDGLDDALVDFYQLRIAKTSAAQAIGRQLAEGIFADRPEPQPAAVGISAEQLSRFWMQGL